MRREWITYAIAGVALVAAIIIFPSFLNFNKQPEANPGRCRMDLSIAPALRGLRLGMSTEELKAKHPDLKIETRTDSEGLSSAFIDQGTKGFDSEGIAWVSLGFVDGQLSDIDVHYINDPAYQQHPHVLIDKVTRQVGMDSRWCDRASASICVIKCDRFEVTIKAPKTFITGTKLSITEPSISFRALIAQQKLQARREVRDEKARKSFKP